MTKVPPPRVAPQHPLYFGADVPDYLVTEQAVVQWQGSLSIGWGQITSTPTTIAGYGITDTYTDAEIDALLAVKAPITDPTFTGVVQVNTAATPNIVLRSDSVLTTYNLLSLNGQTTYTAAVGVFGGDPADTAIYLLGGSRVEFWCAGSKVWQTEPTVFYPRLDATVSIGSSSLRFKDLYLSGLVEAATLRTRGSISVDASVDRVVAGIINAIPTNSAGCYVGWLNSGLGFSAGSLSLIPRSSAGGSIVLYSGSTTPSARIQLDSNGNLLWPSDNALDIGASGATRPRRLYLGTELVVGSNPASVGTIRLPNNSSIYARNAANTADVPVFVLTTSNNFQFSPSANHNFIQMFLGSGKQFSIYDNDLSTELTRLTSDYLFLLKLGLGLSIKEGTNGTMGVATLVGGTVTVNNTKVTASSRIFPAIQAPGGTVGVPQIASRVNGTSFTITSTSAADTSTVAWVLIEGS